MNKGDKFAVVFDTNAYRELTRNNILIAELVRLEQNNEIQAFANIIVMMELLSHLADTKDASYQNCKSAVIALVEHCSIQNNGCEIAILADCESQLCKTLFNEWPPCYQETTEKLAKICRYISEHQAENDIDKIRSDLQEIAAAVENKEQHFIDDMKKYVVKGFNQNATDWEPLKKDKKLRKTVLEFISSPGAPLIIANGLALKTYVLLNKSIDSELICRGKFIAEHFVAPIRLYNEIVRRIVMTGCNLEKDNRRNWIWDMCIAFVLAEHSCLVENRQVRMVTGDGDIVEAAKQANCDDRVYSLKDYINALKDDTFQ